MNSQKKITNRYFKCNSLCVLNEEVEKLAIKNAFGEQGTEQRIVDKSLLDFSCTKEHLPCGMAFYTIPYLLSFASDFLSTCITLYYLCKHYFLSRNKKPYLNYFRALIFLNNV